MPSRNPQFPFFIRRYVPKITLCTPSSPPTLDCVVNAQHPPQQNVTRVYTHSPKERQMCESDDYAQQGILSIWRLYCYWGCFV